MIKRERGKLDLLSQNKVDNVIFVEDIAKPIMNIMLFIGGVRQAFVLAANERFLIILKRNIPRWKND